MCRFAKEVIKVNKELVEMLVNVVIGCIVIMTLIAVACLVTPKIARLIEKKYPNLKESPERVEDKAKGHNPEEYEATGAFESSKLDDFDPNYKIYNKDIYGVDFKHGKKQKNG